MTALFSTALDIDHQSVVYQVYEDEGKYIFVSENSEGPFHNFSLVRNGDHWNELELDKVSPQVKAQAVDTLNKYVLTDTKE
jgi:hypothetical protein